MKVFSKKIIADAQKLCDSNKIKFSGIVIEGNSGFEIVKFAQNKLNKIGMFVIDSRGKGQASEVFLGSVSNYVIHKARIPVMIVK